MISKIMLSPKMQRNVRVNEQQLIVLSERAYCDHSLTGYLYKKSSDSSKWKLRWFVLYQNLLFYYDSESCHRPSGVLFLEGCYCERLITIGNSSKFKDATEKQYCFTVLYRRENVRQYEFRALNEIDCKNWIEAVKDASFNKLLQQKEELEQKHLHLLQIIESEKTAKWQYTQQCEDLDSEIKKLRNELNILKKEFKKTTSSNYNHHYQYTSMPTSSSTTCGSCMKIEQNSLEMKKIKKVQSFFRGWLCRRRWKQIVEQYIKSPHAESMRKRNNIVFCMVEAEEEYMEQLEVLVSCFLRSFKMAASSKKPVCSHEDVNSIFLNSETVLFLHQIFLKGLRSRLESWPTLVLGDLFSMLLPMLSIYQEYVRNHHYSLQVLTECKQCTRFTSLLKRLESKSVCRGRSLETFLTYPMHQVPRYIITLHELLAHTPHDHVERKSLENARQQLEDLSRQMHDEVSETENLRKNLAIERMIAEGCDILLDVNQVFVRQGTLIQLPTPLKDGQSKSKFATFKNEKDYLRQCFLFSNHLIVATRTSSGKLHLLPNIGKIPLINVTLIEDPNEDSEEGKLSPCSTSSQASTLDARRANLTHNQDFKIVVDFKTTKEQAGRTITLHFIASSLQDKAAWISDISQCLDNVQYNDMMKSSTSNNGSVALSSSVKNDPKLFKDEADIKFSKTMNSCKIPQIRYATPERLLQRLTDLRFLSIDFLNTFLITYRVFTDGITVLEALKRVFYNTERELQGSFTSLETYSNRDENTLQFYDDKGHNILSPRRTSGASSVSGYGSEFSERDRSYSYDSQGHKYFKTSLHKYDEDRMSGHKSTKQTLVTSDLETLSEKVSQTISEKAETFETSQDNNSHLTIPKSTASSSSETLTDVTVLNASNSLSNLSSTTLTSSNANNNEGTEIKDTKVSVKTDTTIVVNKVGNVDGDKKVSKGVSERQENEENATTSNTCKMTSCSSSRSASISNTILANFYDPRRSIHDFDIRHSSFQHESPNKLSKAGVVITSFRKSKRRSSTSSSATAFAVATSGSSNPRDISQSTNTKLETADKSKFKENIISNACTMHVLNVLRHWISKHSQDFENDLRLKSLTIEFLDDVICNPYLLSSEHKSAIQILKLLLKEGNENSKDEVFKLMMNPSVVPCNESIATLSALEIAEQLTYIDHKIFISISSDELLGQAWMKDDKKIKAPNIILMTKRFNDVSRLVASEILRCQSMQARIVALEKWTAVADISRCLHNFNGVLQICSAFTNTSVFRLKKTWDKVSKTTKQTIEKLQSIISSDGRFRSLRDALHKCDPPCIPYLGLYLTDLSFIEEGTPNFTQDGLLNFSKMRMIANVVREIRHFQQTQYKIELIKKVANYLLDSSLLMSDDELYNTSLFLEPRISRLNTKNYSK